ncbi:DNA mismatch repair protein MutS, partial [Halobacterium salinarum]|nr:DNA mismatch repair protein MutS [Halobacterium salinarum]
FRVTRGADSADAVTELYRFAPAEVLPGPALRGDDDFLGVLRERTDATLTLHDAGAFDAGRATHRVREQFGDGVIESLGVAADGPVVRAAGAAVGYIAAADEGVLASVSRIQPFGGGDHVELDATTQRNLELTETMTGGSDGSLLATIDHTASAAGGRRLAAWVTRPTRDRAELDRRQAAVGALADAALARDALGDVLGEIYDLERLASRAASGRADATDLLRVRDTLAALPDVADALTTTPELAESPARDVLARVDRAAAADVRAELADALADEPPETLSEGGLL